MQQSEIETWRSGVYNQKLDSIIACPSSSSYVERLNHTDEPCTSRQLTPSMSLPYSRSLSPTKRQRYEDFGRQSEDTPKAKSPTYTPSIVAASDNSCQSSGRLSRSSPSNLVNKANVLEDSYRFERLPTRLSELVNPNLQSFAKRLMTAMNTWKDLHCIFPEELRNDLEHHAFNSAIFYKPGGSANPDFPDYAFLKQVEDHARMCESKQQLESMWNLNVHSFVLEKVWGSCLSNGLTSVNYLTHCPVICDFRTSGIKNAMLDFYVTVNAESKDQELILQLRKFRPEHSINHSASGALCNEPIAISIETKLCTGVLKEAAMQMAAWHLAHWRSLYFRRNEPLQHISFLVGIIVYGHDWYVVMSTYDGHKSTIWRDIHLGGTENIVSIARLISSLRFLKTWAETEYWPAYRRDILRTEQ